MIKDDEESFSNPYDWIINKRCIGNQFDSVTCGVFTLFGIERDIRNKKININNQFKQSILKKEGTIKIIMTLYDFFVIRNLPYPDF